MILKLNKKKCTLSMKMSYIISMEKIKEKQLTDLHIRISVSLFERLKRFCKSMDVKYSKVIKDLIDKHLRDKGY